MADGYFEFLEDVISQPFCCLVCVDARAKFGKNVMFKGHVPHVNCANTCKGCPAKEVA